MFTGTLVNEITPYTLQIHPDLHLHDPYFMGKVLHHCDPNCRVDLEHRTLIALQPIQPGDLVTIDYEVTEDRLYKPFDCNCTAEHCRGWIKGKMEK